MPEQVVDTNRKEKQQFWKRLGIGCRTLGKMTLDTAVKNRSVIIELAYMGCSLLGSFLILRWALTRTDSSRTLKAKSRKQKKELAKRWGKNVELEGEFENVCGCNNLTDKFFIHAVCHHTSLSADNCERSRES
jgi:hypothetical protein